MIRSKECSLWYRGVLYCAGGTSFSLCLYGNLFAFEYAPKQYCHNRTFEQPDFFDHWIFYRPADCLRIWIYTRANWGRSCIQANPSLFRDKFKRIPLSRFHQGQIGQYVNTMTSDVSNYEQILTHRTGNLVKNISLSVMLILFVCFLYLPAGLILIAISLLFIPNMWLSFRIVKIWKCTQ